MSSSSSKVSSSKTTKKKSSSAGGGVLDRLIGDTVVSPPSRKDSSGDSRPAEDVRPPPNQEGSGDGSPPTDDDDGSPSFSLFARISRADFKRVVLDGLPDPSVEPPLSAEELLNKGVKQMEKVTIGYILRTDGAAKELMARADYPNWDGRCRLVRLSNFSAAVRPPSTNDPRSSFSSSVVCHNDPRQLAEIIVCILLSSNSMTNTLLYVDRLFRELWVFLFKNGIGADDGLALLDYADLEFPPNLVFLPQLQAKKGLWHIIQAVKVTQSMSPRLYLTRDVPFSTILQIVRDPSVVSVQDSSVGNSQNGVRTVTFDASVKSHAPPDLELPMLAMDASDFLDYRKSVEYVFQSRGVKQYLTETDASQLVSSWSEAFCARLHASIAKSTISYINEQLKNESSVARLWDGIKNCFDDAGQQLDRELRTWITLFQLTVDHIDDFASFLNTYKTAMSQLRAVNSIALGDAALMRALIIRSVTCEEFHSVMIDLSKNQSIQPDDMIKAVEDHYRAHQHRATIAGHSSSGTKAIRRGAKSDSAAGADKGSSSATKLGWNVPPFPRTLHDCVGGFIFNQLKKWRVHCSKDNYTAEDETMRKNWVIYKTPEGTKHGGGGDKGRSCDSDGNRKNRGSKKNHHRNKDRRGRRGDRRSRSRSRDKDSESDYDSVESDRSYERRESRRGERRSSRHGSGRSR